MEGINLFSEPLKIMLIKKGMTQKELAEKINTSPASLNNLISRDNFSDKMKLKIAEALNCDLKIELIPRD